MALAWFGLKMILKPRIFQGFDMKKCRKYKGFDPKPGMLTYFDGTAALGIKYTYDILV